MVVGGYILKRDGFSGYVSAGASMGDNGNHTTATTIGGLGFVSLVGCPASNFPFLKWGNHDFIM